MSLLHTRVKDESWRIELTVMSAGTVLMLNELLMLSTFEVKKSAKISGDIGDWRLLSGEELRALSDAKMCVLFSALSIIAF